MMKKQCRAMDNIMEDHLQKTLGRTGPGKAKTTDNKMLPRPKHSCFGDFTAKADDKKMNQNALKVEPLAPQSAIEASAADARQTMRKFNFKKKSCANITSLMDT